jgi:ribosomal protein RSM22 (predicted rRNA methylase)
LLPPLSVREKKKEGFNQNIVIQGCPHNEKCPVRTNLSFLDES